MPVSNKHTDTLPFSYVVRESNSSTHSVCSEYDSSSKKLVTSGAQRISVMNRQNQENQKTMIWLAALKILSWQC